MPSNEPQRRPASGPRAVTVRLISLATNDQLVASHDPRPGPQRELTIIELVDSNGNRGFGECPALTTVGYSNEWAAGAFDELVATNGQPGDSSPMAKAALEMARLDLHLNSRGLSLAGHLHAGSFNKLSDPTADIATSIPAGIVLPLASIGQTIEAADHWAKQGVRRLKLKIQPGHAFAVADAVHRTAPGIELHVDANGSCTAADLDELVSLASVGVTVIEQPFAVEDRARAAVLAAASPALVAADEAATGLDTIRELVETGAATAIVIKPGRLGGLFGAVLVHDWCADAGIGVSAGGMLESGLGRHALAALASLPGFTITGDVSPAARWLAEDPFADLVMSDGAITVPTGPGVAPVPDTDLLDSLTIRRAEFTLEG